MEDEDDVARFEDERPPPAPLEEENEARCKGNCCLALGLLTAGG